MAFSRNGLITAGVILAVLGLLGFAIPVITTQETTEVARIGDLKVRATQDKSYPIPPLLAGGAFILGIVLIGAGAIRR